MPQEFIVIVIIFLAVFTQSISGFGSALVAMALLPTILSIHVATPLVALVVIPLEVYLLFHYRHVFHWKAIWRVIAAAVVGIPIGFIYLRLVDEQIVLRILGALISGYALYALLNIRLPTLAHPAWGFVFGLLAGLIGGAYNTSGPPVVLYGTSRGWSPSEFKSNLQGFFVFSSTFTLSGHALNHNLTPEVWHYFWLAMPAIAAGIFAGTSLDSIIQAETFRKIILALLVVIGLRLIV
ncbi:MAG: sulfite exporter TauE/SafE family protein [Chloroflexi bacterium]|jgi:uncharacterized protein|nr:sulfite exporter TauE/SafE family protein [Chloroflexota bacterium]